MAASETSPQSLPHFISSFPSFIRIDFSCKHIDGEHPHEIADALLHGAHNLCRAIVSSTSESHHDSEDEDGNGENVQAQLWPTLLTTCEADALISREASQDRGTILVGLVGSSTHENVTNVLRSWSSDTRSTTLFIDYIPPPSLAVLFVQRADLGQLVVDRWTYPALLASPSIVAFTPTSSHSIPVQASPSAAPSAKAQRAGNPVAAATKLRSPSPSTSTIPNTNTSTKKLTPAPAILNRLRWDDAFTTSDYVVVYEDRHAGLMESPLEQWSTESTEESFVPLHRVRAVKRRSTGMVVWHREERIDLVSLGV